MSDSQEKKLPDFTPEQLVILLSIQREILQLNVQSFQIEKALEALKIRLGAKAGEFAVALGVKPDDVTLDLQNLKLKTKEVAIESEELGRSA